MSARDALVTTTIVHLAQLGPVGVQPQEICAELGISKALVNYHFGGREGLIAEAVTTAFERHSAHLVELAGRVDDGIPATAALEALIEYQVRWGSEQPGLVAATAHPDVAVGRGNLSDAQHERMAGARARNFAAMQKVVIAARAELTDGRPFGTEAEARQMAAVIGWITLGMLTWNGGMFLPMRNDEVQGQFDQTRQFLHSLIREALVR